jgi:hypothetical protein
LRHMWTASDGARACADHTRKQRQVKAVKSRYVQYFTCSISD